MYMLTGSRSNVTFGSDFDLSKLEPLRNIPVKFKIFSLYGYRKLVKIWLTATQVNQKPTKGENNICCYSAIYILVTG